MHPRRPNERSDSTSHARASLAVKSIAKRRPQPVAVQLPVLQPCATHAPPRHPPATLLADGAAVAFALYSPVRSRGSRGPPRG
jgi:hypothetical protein